jgi:hypothetical protein
LLKSITQYYKYVSILNDSCPAHLIPVDGIDGVGKMTLAVEVA